MSEQLREAALGPLPMASFLTSSWVCGGEVYRTVWEPFYFLDEAPHFINMTNSERRAFLYLLSLVAEDEGK